MMPVNWDEVQFEVKEWHDPDMDIWVVSSCLAYAFSALSFILYCAFLLS